MQLKWVGRQLQELAKVGDELHIHIPGQRHVECHARCQRSQLTRSSHV